MALSTAVLSTSAPTSYEPRVYMERGGDALRGTSSGRILMGNTSSGFIKIQAEGKWTDSTSATYTVAGNVTLTSDADLRQQFMPSSQSGVTLAARSQFVHIGSSAAVHLPTPAAGLRIDAICVCATSSVITIGTGSTKIFINSSAGKDSVIHIAQTTASNSNWGLYIPFFGVDATHWICGNAHCQQSDTGVKLGIQMSMDNSS